MKDDRGFSLVELIIVVAIMAVMGGFLFYGFSLLTGQNAKECANDLAAALNKEKNQALTKSATVDCYLELMHKSDGYYVRYYIPASAIAKGSSDADWVLAEEEKIGKNAVDVTCTLDGTDVVIADSRSVKIIYDRINGSVKGAVISDGSTVKVDSITEYQQISFTIDCGRTYKIELFPATGKHVLSRL